jgi:predicted dehydrogenase
MTYRAAVIGTGQPGLYHMQAYSQNPRTELVAVWGRDGAKLAQLQQEYDLPLATTDLEAILARQDVDCLSLCVPNHLHADWSARALRAGKHVFCEVPMVPRLADATQLIQAVEETGLVLQVGQIDRFEPAFIHIKRLVEAGELGRPFLAESSFLGRGWTRHMPADWWGRDARNPQIALVSLGCFPVSLLRWVMGPVAQVSAYATRQGWPQQAHEDTVVANLRFQSGAVGRILVSEAAQRPYAMDLAVYGDQGTIVNNQLALNRLLDVGRDAFFELPIPLIAWRDYPDPAVQGLFDAAIDELLRSIKAGTPPSVDVQEGAAIAATLDGIIQSMDTGRPVTLPQR